MTRLISNLPETTNGLDAISDDILTSPREERIVVAILDCPKAHEDFDNNRRIPYMRVRAIEPLAGGQAETARKLLEDNYVRRTGQDSLTLDQALSGDEPEPAPCPAWFADDGDDADQEPCIYDKGHGGDHKTRGGTEWADTDG